MIICIILFSLSLILLSMVSENTLLPPLTHYEVFVYSRLDWLCIFQFRWCINSSSFLAGCLA